MLLRIVKHVFDKKCKSVHSPFKPPEIIVLYRVIAFQFPVREYLWGQPHFITATPHKPIAGHHPSDKKAMFLKALDAVCRA